MAKFAEWFVVIRRCERATRMFIPGPQNTSLPNNQVLFNKKILVCKNTWKLSNQLQNAEVSGDGVAEGVDDCDADEDGGHVGLSSLPSWWFRLSYSFLPDSFVDEEVDEDQEDEGSKAEEKGWHGSNLSNKMYQL